MRFTGLSDYLQGIPVEVLHKPQTAEEYKIGLIQCNETKKNVILEFTAK